MLLLRVRAPTYFFLQNDMWCIQPMVLSAFVASLCFLAFQVVARNADACDETQIEKEDCGENG